MRCVCSANGTLPGQPQSDGGQLGLAGLMLASMFLRLLLILMPVFVVCRVLALVRDASLRAHFGAEPPRLVALDRELQSLVQVGLSSLPPLFSGLWSTVVRTALRVAWWWRQNLVIDQ